MNGFWAWILGVGLLVSGLAQGSMPPDVTVARFKGDRQAAVSLTFDDALPSHIESAIPSLDRYGLKGTFFLLLSNIRQESTSNWDAWRGAVSNGHEAGSHTFTHPMLTQVRDPALLDYEIAGSAKEIEAHLGVRPTSFAYPSSDVNHSVRQAVRLVYAFDRSDCRVWGGAGFQVEDGIKHVEQAVRRKEWFYCMLHGVGENTWGPIDPEIFDGLMAYLSRQSGTVWTDTYSRIAAYIAKRNAVKVTFREVKPDAFDFRLRLPDDPHIAMIPKWPLTVKVALDGRDPKLARALVDGSPLVLTPSACGHYLLADIETDGRWIQWFWK